MYVPRGSILNAAGIDYVYNTRYTTVSSSSTGRAPTNTIMKINMKTSNKSSEKQAEIYRKTIISGVVILKSVERTIFKLEIQPATCLPVPARETRRFARHTNTEIVLKI